MFSAMTGPQASARPVGPGGTTPPGLGVGRTVARAGVPEAAPAAEVGFVSESDENPYVEIGGPTGTVFSRGAVLEPVPRPEPIEPEPPPPAPRAEGRTFPRLATPLYLSVTFHDLSGKPRPRAAVDGPDPGLVALHLPDHPVSGEYRVLRDELRAQLPDPTPRVLLFSAGAREAGTTTVLLNLAITLAREDAPRVLVVDANLPAADAPHRDDVAERLAQPAGPGLAEVLAQQVPLPWALRPTAVPNLQVLAAGAMLPGVTAVIGEDLPKLIEQLRQWYDWVLIDGGVWGAEPERDAVCPSVDAVYLVSRASDVDRSEFAAVRGRVKELGGLLRGYITTRV